MYLSFERKFLLCVSDCLVRRFVRYSGARPFRDLNTITRMLLNSFCKSKPAQFLKHLFGWRHKVCLKYYSGCSLLQF